MRTIKPLIASNGIAIFLTIICLLPLTAILALGVTAPLDDVMASFGMWLHHQFGWTGTEFDTIMRFSKMGFALRIVVIAVGISFLYFAVSNWLTMGLARKTAKGSVGITNCRRLFLCPLLPYPFPRPWDVLTEGAGPWRQD